MNNQKSLINQLQEFGLNPRFWLLKKLNQKGIWLIMHKNHQGLYLKGKVTHRKRWKELEWLIE